MQFALQHIGGFNSREYFHQVFLEKTGTTPAKYQASYNG